MLGARKSFTFLILIFCCFSLLPAVDKVTALRIKREIRDIEGELIKIRRLLHMNPELSNQEQETAKLIASKLMPFGLEIQRNVAGNGVAALLRGYNEGMTVAFRAEMDAMPIEERTNLPYQSLNPGVMHACGHDIHMTIALGTAMVLSSLRKSLKGNIKFIFQPAQEASPFDGDSGAKLMLEEGILDNPSVGAIFGLQSWPGDVGTVFLSQGTILAGSDWFRLNLKGKSSPASKPQEGKDALSLASQVMVTVQSLLGQTIDPTEPYIVSFGKIQGGTRANIIPREVQLEGVILAINSSTIEKIRSFMIEVVQGLCKPIGAEYELVFKEKAPPLYNHPELIEIIKPTLEELLGPNNINPVQTQLIADDFSYFSHKIPGFYLLLGVKDPSWKSMPPLYSSTFSPDERCISLGIQIMCHIIIDCLEKQFNSGI